MSYVDGASLDLPMDRSMLKWHTCLREQSTVWLKYTLESVLEYLRYDQVHQVVGFLFEFGLSVNAGVRVPKDNCFCCWYKTFSYNFGEPESFLWSHWYPSFKLLVTPALGFKARVDPLLVCIVPFTPCLVKIVSLKLIEKHSMYLPGRWTKRFTIIRSLSVRFEIIRPKIKTLLNFHDPFKWMVLNFIQVQWTSLLFNELNWNWFKYFINLILIDWNWFKFI